MLGEAYISLLKLAKKFKVTGQPGSRMNPVMFHQKIIIDPDWSDRFKTGGYLIQVSLGKELTQRPSNRYIILWLL